MTGRRWRSLLGVALGATTGAVLALALATWAALAPLPPVLDPPPGEIRRAAVVDRRGEPLALTYGNAFNADDTVPLHAVPPLLRAAFVEAEDRRFLDHHGVDWRARAAALVQNARAGGVVRGASTISEQVARMLVPRPRSPWSHWLAGFEAAALERRFGKAACFEFYLNQVPYSDRRRGIAQAARTYFDRDLSTLAAKEMLALAVVVRSPQRLDPRRAPPALERAIQQLAVRLEQHGLLDAADRAAIAGQPLATHEPRLALHVPHFVQHVRGLVGPGPARVRTTLDAALTRRVERLLAGQIRRLRGSGAGDGAALVADHTRDEVLAWVNADVPDLTDAARHTQIDAVLAARQPGSTLKPFLYALALDRDFTAASLLDDAPLATGLGAGLHRYRNYSRTYHGPVRLREALGNSLNIPAVRLVQALGPQAFEHQLHALGFASLARRADFYGDGLALGNGEVTLYELVTAYACLARGGMWRPLHVTLDPRLPLAAARRAVSDEAASIVGDILSDPEARRLEFGAGGLLELPLQTAVKTGTSSDYRDAWALGFSHRYTVGVWLGNLDRRAMEGVSGSIGPALVLRAIFAELARASEPRALFVSTRLRRLSICRVSGAAAGPLCPLVNEWFQAGRSPAASCGVHRAPAERVASSGRAPVRLVQPTPGLHLARDPRIPDELEAFPFEIATDLAPHAVEWFVDDRLAGTTGAGARSFAWPVAAGEHEVEAVVRFAGDGAAVRSGAVRFHVR